MCVSTATAINYLVWKNHFGMNVSTVSLLASEIRAKNNAGYYSRFLAQNIIWGVKSGAVCIMMATILRTVISLRFEKDRVHLPPGRPLMPAAILANCDMASVTAGVGWVSIRHRTPAKPARSHTAINANLPLCDNNSTAVLCFLQKLCFRACLVYVPNVLAAA